MNNKIHKSASDRMISGVCGGIGEYFGVDSTWIRLAWVVFCLLGGCGIIVYIAFAVILPSEAAFKFQQSQEMGRMRNSAVDADYEIKE